MNGGVPSGCLPASYCVDEAAATQGPATAMTTIKDVARRAGVSTMTVSRVVNKSGYASDATRARVEQAIGELGYVPNALARHFRSKRTRTVALVLSDITNPFFTTIARGVEDCAAASNFAVMFCNTDESEVEENEYLQMLMQRQIDGVLLVPSGSPAKPLQRLRSRNVRSPSRRRAC